ncbi:MAG: sugar ABC transporter ATP-binding protein [Candidatus Sumerlaeota bacterium]|nr:sugar ABC transporter ATP-binding protein [Candidatus Sumerlaeota bacterium]
MTSPILEAREIVKDFPGVRALEGVSFAVRAGEIHALVGENGAGKSTLIKILSGVYPHGDFAGEILLDGRPARFRSSRDSEDAGIGVIHQELALVKHLTVGENIFLGDEPARFGLVDWDRMFAQADEAMRELGHSINVRSEVVSLGVGEQQLVEIAKAVRRRNRVLILDEPTAALSDQETRRLMNLMRDWRARGLAMIYISHKLDEVFEVADRITVLRDGRTIAGKPASEWTRDTVIQAMVGRDLKEMFPHGERKSGQTILEVENLSLEDAEVSGRMILQGISFQARAGEVLGIAGLMGAGRTELLQALFGAHPGRVTGSVRIAGRAVRIRSPLDAVRAGFALAPEDRKRHGLVLILSVLENLAMAAMSDFSHAGVIDDARQFQACRDQAREWGVKAPDLRAAVQTLSGGNQQKVILGKWLMRRPKVLFLDEPTRGIDVGAKAEIHALIDRLAAAGLAVVMVSSELPEVLGVSDRILVLREGRLAAEFSRAEATAERVMAAAT